jgi:hypothetical protein
MYVNGSAILNNVVLADTFATNDPFRLVTGAAVHVQSDDVAEPLIDGIILESGNSGDSRPSVMIKGCKVPTPLAITQDIQFWLGIDGKITSTIPTLAHGDVWLVPVCHSDELGYLIFDDPMPIKL